MEPNQYLESIAMVRPLVNIHPDSPVQQYPADYFQSPDRMAALVSAIDKWGDSDAEWFLHNVLNCLTKAVKNENHLYNGQYDQCYERWYFRGEWINLAHVEGDTWSNHGWENSQAPIKGGGFEGAIPLSQAATIVNGLPTVVIWRQHDRVLIDLGFGFYFPKVWLQEGVTRETLQSLRR